MPGSFPTEKTEENHPRKVEISDFISLLVKKIAETKKDLAIEQGQGKRLLKERNELDAKLTKANEAKDNLQAAKDKVDGELATEKQKYQAANDNLNLIRASLLQTQSELKAEEAAHEITKGQLDISEKALIQEKKNHRDTQDDKDKLARQLQTEQGEHTQTKTALVVLPPPYSLTLTLSPLIVISQIYIYI